MKKIILIIVISFSHSLHAMNIMDIAGPAFIGISGIIFCHVGHELKKNKQKHEELERTLAESLKKIDDMNMTVEIDGALDSENINPLLRSIRDTPRNRLQKLRELDMNLVALKIEALKLKIDITERLFVISKLSAIIGSLLCLKTAAQFFYDDE